MKNIGLIKLKNADVDTFTTDIGICIRRFINPIVRKILSRAIKCKVIVESYPKLEKEAPYIFASTHSFDEDIISNLAYIDRSAYVLLGTTDQLEHNPQMYFAWLNGFIYVNRCDKRSREDSVKKMKRILNKGSSILIFPEGGWNNTENLLVLPLFAGCYTLSRDVKVPVVLASVFCERNSETIYLRYGKPLNLWEYEKSEAIKKLRDEMATMIFESMEKHALYMRRVDLNVALHLNYLEERKAEYMRVKWTRDNWDEELTTYCKKGEELPEEVCKFVEHVHVNGKNAGLIAAFLKDYEYYARNNLKQYLRRGDK